ncbi:MAG: hypothetical protein H0U69_07190, partial [Trueperaceae bacterium]|nr:hypothetical protein [Trueperaceae bacterium]
MGAHCCFTYHLLSLGDDLRVLWRAETRDSAVVLVDLRGDGGRQLLMTDMSFAYEFCSFADSPAPTVVLQVQDAHVVVANSSFPEAYDRDIAWALERALEVRVDERPEIERCAVAHLVLTLLYA